MKKVNFTGSKNLAAIEQNTDMPRALLYETKKSKQNYLKHTPSKTKVTLQPGDIQGGEPIPMNEKPKKLQLHVQAGNSDSYSCSSDECSSECDCVKKMVPLAQRKLTLERRRKKKNVVPYFEQSVLDDYQKIRRIQFVYTSSSDSSYYEEPKKPTTESSIIYQAPVMNPFIDNIQPQDQVMSSVIAPPQKSQTLKSSMKPAKYQSTQFTNDIKQPKIQKYEQKPPEEEWAKYQTPDVVHPIQLTKPSKKQEITGPSRPLYRKPKERKAPKQQAPPGMIPLKISNGVKPPTQQLRTKDGKFKPIEANGQESSSDCCCDCICDC